LILVCHPLPCALKKLTTSGLKRIETGTLSGAFCVPRTLGGMSGCISFTGFMRDSMSLESGGDSTASQSSCAIGLGLRFIIFLLTFIGSAQADYTNGFGTTSINHHMQSLANKTQGNPTFLSVIETIIDSLKGGVPFKIHDGNEINVVSGKVGGTFVLIPFILHRL